MKQFSKVVFLLFMTFSLFAQGDPVDISCEGSLTVAVGGSLSGDSLTIVGVTTDNMCDPASGDVTGSVDITVSGGTPPYAYLWTQEIEGSNDVQPYATSEDLDDLVAGEYCVTVTSSLTVSQQAIFDDTGVAPDGCIVEMCFTINQPPPVTIAISADPLDCNEYNATPDGQVDVTAGGGTPGYLYEWEYEGDYTDNLVNTSGSPNTNPLATQVALPAGWYFVTVYDTQGCQANDSIEITQPDSLILAGTLNQPDCNVLSTPTLEGSITIEMTNGVAPFSFAWTGPGTTAGDQNQTELGTGTYAVTVTDFTGCQVEGTWDLIEPTEVTADASGTDPGCAAATNSGDDGEISVTPGGGTGTDDAPADDASDYTYLWTGPGVDGTNETQQTITGLGAGTYDVTVYDANNCTATAQVVLGEPSVVVATPGSTEPLCNANSGTLSGEVTVTGTEGTPGTAPDPDYTYLWTGPGVDGTNETQQTITGLGTGTYDVTVYDSNNCSATAQVTLTEPTEVTASASGTDPGCAAATNSGSNGEVTVIGGAGTPGTAPNEYTYLWTGPGVDGTNETQQTITGLGAGTYDVTVYDSNNCSATDQVTLGEPTSVVATPGSTEPLCNANSGTLTGEVTVTGTEGTPGTAPNEYTYLWTGPGVDGTNETQQTITGLGTGTYDVTVYDSNNCTATAQVTLTEPTEVTASASGTDPGCAAATNSGSNGEVTVTGGAGTPGTAPNEYTYLWTGPGVDGTNETQQTITGLGAGTYDVTVYDSNNCSATDQVTLGEPTSVVATPGSTEPLCNANSGTLTGEVTVTGTEGTPGTAPNEYTYLWTGPGVDGTNETQQTITGLGTGTYDVTVYDSNNCSATAQVTLTEPTEVTASASGTDPGCAAATNSGSNGEVTVIGGAGTPGTAPNEYTYLWTGPGVDGTNETQQTITGLGAGTYDVTVYDSNNCSATDQVTLGEPTSVVATPGSTEPLCNANSGTLTGEVTVTGTEGTPGTAPNEYTYLWTGPGVDGSNETQQTITGLGTGTYDVTVYDSNNCSATAQVTLTEPTEVTASASGTDPGCAAATNSGSNGEVTVTGGAGTPGTAPNEYTYLWTGPGVDGTNETQQTITGLGAGTYDVTVYDSNNCSATDQVTLGEPTSVVATPGSTEPLCNANSGTLSGEVTVTGTEGTPGTAPNEYTYLWTGPGVDGTNETQQTITGLGTGTYDVTVYDSNNCSATAQVTLTEPTEVTASASGTDPGCAAATNSGSNGEVTVTGGAGTPGTAPNEYTYLWTGPGVDGTNETQQTITGLGAGTYDVTVYDSNNCSATDQVTLGEPTSVVATPGSTEPLCNANSGTLTGEVTVTGTEGTPGTAPNEYTYLWTGPGVDGTNETQQTITGLGTGTYDVTVYDSNNCSATAQVTLTEPTEVTATASGTDPGCAAATNSGSNGEITVTGGAGTPGTAPNEYTYLWTGPGIDGTNETQQTITGLGAGTYDVTVYDSNNCSATDQVTLGEPIAVEITIAMTPLTCNAALAPTDGTVTVTYSGGTASDGTPASAESDYTFTWGDDGLGESGANLSNLPAGTYSVTVADANGCSAQASVEVTQPSTIDIFAVSVNPECNDASGDATGSITIQTATGGTGSDNAEGDELTDYEYTWAADPGNLYDNNLDLSSNTITSQTGLTAGTYYLTVTDENDCMLTADYVLEEPDPITIDSDVIQPACNDASGDLTGEIDITPGGGNGANNTPIYTYEWSGPGISGAAVTAQDQTGLGEGWFYVTVYDDNCSAVDSFNLTEPEPVACVLSNDPEGDCNDILCAGGVDTIFVTPSGGTAPYTYSLDGATAITDSFFIVGAGTYTVTTIDANDCSNTCDITLDEPNPLAGGTCTLDDDCQIGEGQIEVAATGGCAPYTITWTSPTGGTLVPDPNDVNGDGNAVIATEGGSTIFTGAEGGETYNFVIIDANGCQIP